MNNSRIQAEASKLATSRTKYSLAREVLGLRTQVAELKEVNQRQRQLLDRKERDLEGAMQQTERAIAQGQQLAGHLDEARDTLDQYEAEEGQEITELRQELEAAIELAERAGCPACESRPGQFHSPECPAANAFTAGRIGAEANKV